MRGDVFEVKSPRNRVGHEQQGNRYAVVMQDTQFSALSTVVICPSSTTARASSFRPEIDVAGLRTRVLVDQMMAVDYARLGEQVGHLMPAEMLDIDAAMVRFLGLRGELR